MAESPRSLELLLPVAGMENSVRMTGSLGYVATRAQADELQAVVALPSDLTLDLSGVDFIDTARPAFLTSLATGGRRIEIANASRIVRRLFEITGVELLPVDDLGIAFEHGRRRRRVARDGLDRPSWFLRCVCRSRARLDGRATGRQLSKTPGRMRTRVVIAIVLVVIGVVWFGQGIGLIGGSFMTGQALWAIIGAVMIVFALALLSGVQRDRRRNADGEQ